MMELSLTEMGRLGRTSFDGEEIRSLLFAMLNLNVLRPPGTCCLVGEAYVKEIKTIYNYIKDKNRSLEKE